LNDETVIKAMRCIVMHMRAMAPVTANDMWDELLTQCVGVHAANIDRIRQSALTELLKRGIIEMYDAGPPMSWTIHPAMYGDDQRFREEQMP
jgi:hypothetical protein